MTEEKLSEEEWIKIEQKARENLCFITENKFVSLMNKILRKNTIEDIDINDIKGLFYMNKKLRDINICGGLYKKREEREKKEYHI
ncbi:hypothetical protein LCGC14_1063320 [marine sediment metagenome]|uniref:Uncharacterized protein n=1 Tax=marine sediment metagenome TaxID=412755 RepID=A0A0F9MQ58_9ZZZZ|nr:hypothetical protein [bacterium]